MTISTVPTKTLKDFINGQGYGVAPSAVVAICEELLAVREAATPIYQIWDDGRWYDAEERIWRETYNKYCENQFRIVYTAPPAVPNDTRRMDWLVAHHVEVRKPLLYGSQKMFTAQTLTDEEDDYHATSLREQIDAAMAAAPTPTK